LVATDLQARFIFDGFDLFKIFRKNRRNEINLPMSSLTVDSCPINRVHILNISQTGYMAKLVFFEKESKDMTLSINFPYEIDSLPFEVQAELLWASNFDGSFYHGFRFKEMSPETVAILPENIVQLTQQQVEV